MSGQGKWRSPLLLLGVAPSLFVGGAAFTSSFPVGVAAFILPPLGAAVSRHLPLSFFSLVAGTNPALPPWRRPFSSSFPFPPPLG